MVSYAIFPYLVWLGIGQNSDGLKGVYTYGLKKFGKDEMEIYSERSLEEVHAMMFNIASYVLDCNVTLKAGETIGLSEEQKLAITRSEGVSLDCETLKIAF